jgi:phosphoheptose isomerase
MDEREFLKKQLWSRAILNGYLSENKDFIDSIMRSYKLLAEAFKSGKKVLIFGNGGSADQSQHLASELVGKLERTRRPLAAIALTTDASVITAQSNDVGFEYAYSRQIEALGNPDDVAIGFTTSDVDFGNNHSLNIYNAFKASRNIGMKSVGFFSIKTKKLVSLVDVPILVPNKSTSIIQEIHLESLHLVCKLLEDSIIDGELQ